MRTARDYTRVCREGKQGRPSTTTIHVVVDGRDDSQINNNTTWCSRVDAAPAVANDVAAEIIM